MLIYQRVITCNCCSCGILWHLGKLKAFFLSFPVTVVANMRSCNVDTISPNCSLLAVGQSGRSGPRHQKSWGEHSLLRFAPQGFGYHNGLTANQILVKCVVPWIKTKIGTWCWRGCSSDIWGLRAIALLAVLQPLPVEKGFATKWGCLLRLQYEHTWNTHTQYIYIYYIYFYIIN